MEFPRFQDSKFINLCSGEEVNDDDYNRGRFCEAGLLAIVFIDTVVLAPGESGTALLDIYGIVSELYRCNPMHPVPTFSN